MRNQALVVAGVAVLAAAVIIVVALVAFNTGASHPANQVAQPSPSSTSGPGSSASTKPAPTVTVTKHNKAPRRTVVAPPPQPQVGGDDEEFLAMIAADGIKAPDDWAIEAGRKTCGRDYDYAYRYLTDGGIYGYHVQTFLDDWSVTHDGC